MSRPTNNFRVLLVMVAVSAFASQGEGVRPTRDYNVITQEEMMDAHLQTALAAVEAFHPRWLTPRGQDSFRTPSEVWVYMDNVRLGDISTLKTVHPSTFRLIRHFDPNAATARWGVGHAAGVIQIESFKEATDKAGPPPT